MRLALAAGSLLRHRARTILAVLGVAVAAAMLLDMVMMSSGMRESFRELLLSRGYELRVAPKGSLPLDTDATIPRIAEIVAELKRNPGVARISPVLGGKLHFDRGESAVTSAVIGVEPTVQGDYDLVRGSNMKAADEIVMNDALLRALGAKLGDTLDVASGFDPQTRAYAGRRRMRITGEVRFIYGATGQTSAAIQLQTLQAMRADECDDCASFFMVGVRSGADSERIARQLSGALKRVSVISTADAIRQVDERLSYFRQLALILGTVSLGVGFLLVTTLMTVSVNERVGEIAVMRALGISTWHVVQQIVLEGAAISIAGAVGGLGLGLLTARYLNAILSSFPGLPSAIDFFLFEPASAWKALGLLALSGLASGIYPAWRAASLPIATTLRREAIA